MSESTSSSAPDTLSTEQKYEKLNFLLYNHASSHGFDPTIVSLFHHLIVIAYQAKETPEKNAVILKFVGECHRISDYLTRVLDGTNADDCTYTKRIDTLSATASTLSQAIPQSIDYATIGWELLRTIRAFVVDKDTLVRAQGYRSIRYWCTSRVIMVSLLNLGLDALVCRAIEREHKYLWERVQAMKLIRCWMSVDSSLIPRYIVVSLVSIAEHHKDEFHRAALDTLRECAMLQPALFASAGGCRVLAEVVMDPQLQDVSNSMLLTLLSLYDRPSTRALIKGSLDLSSLLSVYTDLSSPLAPEKEAQRACSHKAIVQALRSTTGLFTLCSDHLGLKSVVQMLTMPSSIPGVSWVRDSVFELLFDLISLVKCGDILLHIKSRLPAFMQSSDLNPAVTHRAGVVRVTANGSRGGRSLNLLHNCMALVLIGALGAGLIENLAMLALSAGDEAASVSTKLLVETLRLSVGLLPRSVCAQLTALPSLLQQSVSLLNDTSVRGSTQPSDTSPDQVQEALKSLALAARASPSIPTLHGLNLLGTSGLHGNLGTHLPLNMPLSGCQTSDPATLRIRSLRLLTKLFQENVSFFSKASGLTTSESLTMQSSSGNRHEGVASIGEGSGGLVRTEYIAHGLNLGRLAWKLDSSPDHQMFNDWDEGIRPQLRSRALHALKMQLGCNITDAILQNNLRTANILATKDILQWDWSFMLHMLETCLTVPVHFQAALKTKFFKRILSFLRPEKHLFCEMAWVVSHAVHVRVAAQALRVLLMSPEGREYVFLHEFVEQTISYLVDECQRADVVCRTQPIVISTQAAHLFLQDRINRVCEPNDLVNRFPAHSQDSMSSLSEAPSPLMSSGRSPQQHFSLPRTTVFDEELSSPASLSVVKPLNHPSHQEHRPSVTFTLNPLIDGASLLTVGQGVEPRPHSNSVFSAPKKRIRPFARNAVQTKLSREYVTLLGILTSSQYGNALLAKHGYFEALASLASSPSHDYLVRLVLLSLDYGQSRQARQLLQHWTVGGSSFIRRSIIHHLKVLFRQHTEGFAQWGIDLCIALLYAPDPQVSLGALSVLEEACMSDIHCLNTTIDRSPNFGHFGSFAVPLQHAFLAHAAGLENVCRSGWLQVQLDLWRSEGAVRYVESMDAAMVSALSPHADFNSGDDVPETTVSSAIVAESESTLALPPWVGPTHPWPYHSLWSPVHFTTTDPIITSHDEYVNRRFESIPWIVELAIETTPNRFVQLLTDAFVTTGYADAGVPVVSNIHTPPSDDNQVVKEKDTDSVRIALSNTLMEGECEGAPATYVVGLVLDLDGKPSPFPISPTASIHARLLPCAMAPGQTPLGSSKPLPKSSSPFPFSSQSNPIASLASPSAADEEQLYITYAVGDDVVNAETEALMPLSHTRIRVCTPTQRNNLQVSHYHTDVISELYSERFTLTNSANWNQPTPLNHANPFTSNINNSSSSPGSVSLGDGIDSTEAECLLHCDPTCTLPLCEYAYYVVDGDVRWNLCPDPDHPQRLMLTSVWFRLPPTHDTTPSVSVLSHLMGDVARTVEGCSILHSTGVVQSLVNTITADTPCTIEKRAALWSIGHIASTTTGLKSLMPTGVLNFIAKQALSSTTLSMRGTCYYVLGLVAQTPSGRGLLDKLGWDATEDDSLVSSTGTVAPKDISKFLSVPAVPCTISWPLDPANTVSVARVPNTSFEAGSDDAVQATAKATEILTASDKEDEVSEEACELIMGHVSNLCNRVTQRASLMALRHYKNTYKQLFANPILMGKVLRLVNGHSFKLPTRRFILYDLFSKVNIAKHLDIILLHADIPNHRV